MKIHNLVQFREKFCACEENDLIEYIPYKMFTSTKYSNCKSTIDQSQFAYHDILTTWDEAMENARGWSWGITSKRYSKGRQLLVWGKSCKTCTTKIEKIWLQLISILTQS